MDTKICIVKGCNNKYLAKGYCRLHYKRMYRNGDLLLHMTGYERKNTKKSIQSPTIKDVAWAAGFCEGEASFQYGTSGTSRVSLPQVNIEPLNKMLNLFGGAIYKRPTISVWHISGARARGFMMTIYSFMSDKRKKQIKSALNLKDNLLPETTVSLPS